MANPEKPTFGSQKYHVKCLDTETTPGLLTVLSNYLAPTTTAMALQTLAQCQLSGLKTLLHLSLVFTHTSRLTGPSLHQTMLSRQIYLSKSIKTRLSDLFL